jgi:hypothetical protein
MAGFVKSSFGFRCGETFMIEHVVNIPERGRFATLFCERVKLLIGIARGLSLNSVTRLAFALTPYYFKKK